MIKNDMLYYLAIFIICLIVTNITSSIYASFMIYTDVALGLLVMFIGLAVGRSAFAFASALPQNLFLHDAYIWIRDSHNISHWLSHHVCVWIWIWICITPRNEFSMMFPTRCRGNWISYLNAFSFTNMYNMYTAHNNFAKSESLGSRGVMSPFATSAHMHNISDLRICELRSFQLVN